MQKRIRQSLVIVHDTGMVAVALTAAYTLSNASTPADGGWAALSLLIGLLVPLQIAALRWKGLCRETWSFTRIEDLWDVTQAVMLATITGGLLVFLVNRLDGVPRTMFVLYPVFAIFLLVLPRVIHHVMKEKQFGSDRQNSPSGERVLILGAGKTGERLVHDMIADGHFRPIGFLDDFKGSRAGRIHGVPVLGTIDDLSEVIREHMPQLLVIAMPTASTSQMKRVVERCEQSGLPFRTVPKLQDIMRGHQPIVSELREVAIEDLLGRDPVNLDWHAITEGLASKTVLVTGGGGSIGSELCRQIARLAPTSLVILDNSEHNLYNIELELRRDFPNLVLRAHLGDITDEAAVENIFHNTRPDIVFHAAAYKHVPMLQNQVREAVRNNVIGTRTLAQAADRHGCDIFVLVSTDKAVNPTNVMGASKRVAELYCQNLCRHSATRFITVRFGNVLGSAGSVVPLFQQQIKQGGPVTVTHPDITRYFMTVSEACQLIMQAATMGKGGEIFVLDMGKPLRISYLAEEMIRLSGKIPGHDIKIIYTGLRPGEKLYEELFYPQENLTHTRSEKILLAQHREGDWSNLSAVLDIMEQACRNYDEGTLKNALKRLVPEMGEAKERSNVVPIAMGRT